MAILKELHAQGHTIILVTHDMEVASHADRIITLKDGRVQEDMALHAMLAHRMRTAFLTMLGIIIGIAAVVSVVALGQGPAPR